MMKTPPPWSERDLQALLQTPRLVAAGAVAADRGFGPAETLAFIVRAFPELAAGPSDLAQSIRGFEHLDVAAFQNLLAVAQQKFFSKDNVFLRDAWDSEDLGLLLAMPRFLAVSDAARKLGLASMREFMWRTFPTVYADGYWYPVLPVAKLDTLSQKAMYSLLAAAGEAALSAELSPELATLFPDVYVDRAEY